MFCHNVTQASMVVVENFHTSDHNVVFCTIPFLAKGYKSHIINTRLQYSEYEQSDWENFRFLIFTLTGLVFLLVISLQKR